ncbi:MAG: hypothetical protein FWF20_12275 [Betaproteobacteria bacterium]|nr:hypothetical protein [Betaproteobacteria bacterium]
MTTISLTADDVLAALRAFVIVHLPAGVEVIAAQDNGVAMPAAPFVAMTLVDARRLTTNFTKYTDGAPGNKALAMPTQITVQLDFYGPDSGAWAAIVAALFRDDVAYAAFPAAIKPLYADDPVQLPLIDGEQQFEQRWKLNAVMQTVPVVTVEQESATDLAPGVIEVDAAYPP